MKFKEWIMRYKGEDSPRGDLAYDINRDPDFTSKNERESIEGYLRSRMACRECLEAFKSAWKSYRQYQRRNAKSETAL